MHRKVEISKTVIPRKKPWVVLPAAYMDPDILLGGYRRRVS